MKKILIALDYDSSAQNISEIGYSLARAIDAEVSLMHVISDPLIYSSNGHVTIVGFAGCMEAETDTMKEDCKEELKIAAQQFLDKSKKHLGDESIQTIVKDGTCAESILQVAKEMQADIIVMGAHGRKWIEQKVMGSVAVSVLQHSTIPLFIIPSTKNI